MTDETTAEPPIDPTLVERARQILIPIARNGQRVTYTQFAAQLGVDGFNAINCLPVLTHVADREAEAQRPLLSVVAVNSHNRRPPAELCEIIREVRTWDCTDEEAYLKELALVYDFWRPA